MSSELGKQTEVPCSIPGLGRQVLYHRQFFETRTPLPTSLPFLIPPFFPLSVRTWAEAPLNPHPNSTGGALPQDMGENVAARGYRTLRLYAWYMGKWKTHLMAHDEM